jgi:asparagine synthase (glutamine-hydrolysing)
MKYKLKESFKHILPEEIIEHKKQGFAVPMKMWFKDSLKEYAYDMLLKNSKLETYLDINYVRTILDNHQKGLRNYHTKIWSLLFLNEWLKQNDEP